jgi:hypothetical protein
MQHLMNVFVLMCGSRRPYPLKQKLDDATINNDIATPIELLSMIVDETYQHQ